MRESAEEPLCVNLHLEHGDACGKRNDDNYPDKSPAMADPPHAPSSSLEVAGVADPPDAALQLLLTPKLTASREIHPLKCCCGSVECVLLRHNCSVLDSVEKDVYTAARMGQVRACTLSYQNHIAVQDTAP